VVNAKTGEIVSRANRIFTMERLRNQKFLTGFTGQSKRQVIAGFLCQKSHSTVFLRSRHLLSVRVPHNMVIMIDTALGLLENR
jgi:hypothetical protein